MFNGLKNNKKGAVLGLALAAAASFSGAAHAQYYQQQGPTQNPNEDVMLQACAVTGNTATTVNYLCDANVAMGLPYGPSSSGTTCRITGDQGYRVFYTCFKNAANGGMWAPPGTYNPNQPGWRLEVPGEPRQRRHRDNRGGHFYNN